MSIKLPTFDYLLLKLAARCNLNCTYCYWFKDESVYEKPKILTQQAENALLKKLDEHIKQYSLKYFSILFHGGEPLLFGKKRFLNLVEKLKVLGEINSCDIRLSITTNGILVDDEWAFLFSYFHVGPTISIDGPEAINDLARKDFSGRGSYEKIVKAITTLRKYGIEPGILAVCNPHSDPKIITEHFVNDLHLKHFDILIPDATHDNPPVSIASYYKKLFDMWYYDYSKKDIDIRYIRAMLKGILGGESHLESIGYGPIQTVAMLTDGSLEPLDVLRIAGYQSTRTDLSIFTHTFQDVLNNVVWRNAFEAALELPPICKECEYSASCGGGFLPHRWSKENKYNNHSVYCNDLKDIFGHIWDTIVKDLKVVTPKENIELAEVLSEC